MLRSSRLHELVCWLTLEVKRAIYTSNHGGCLAALRRLAVPPEAALAPFGPDEPENGARQEALIPWEYEHSRILARVQEVLARRPRVGPDALAALAFPVTVELRQWFVEARDERTRLIAAEIDPGLPAAYYPHWPYWGECHPE